MAESTELKMDLPNRGGDATVNGDRTARLEELTAQATAKYSVKDYNAAAELYAYATELQVEINGEMSSENADIFYVYGRCLYHLAVKKSDVLGLSRIPGDEAEASKAAGSKRDQKRTRPEDLIEDPEKKSAGEVLTQLVDEKEGSVKPKEETRDGTKPFFQFTGDENFEDSDDDEDAEDEDGVDGDEVEGEEDDFSTAYEVLDMARVLLQKKIAEAEDSATGKSKGKEESSELRQLKERLADTYDLQAEISLEGEKFPTAVIDLKSALELKKELYSQESNFLAEAHYKLSLALEFSSVTQQKGEDGEAKGEAHVDEGMREEAAKELEAAISSCKLRIQQEEANLRDPRQVDGEDGKPKVTKAQIDDVKDMVKELSRRLVEIRQPPVSINDPTGTGTIDGSNPLAGILGSMLGESPAAQKARIEEASKGANDLTGLVKKKKPARNDASKDSEPEAVRSNGNGKRKVDFDDEIETGKKAKVEDVDETGSSDTLR